MLVVSRRAQEGVWIGDNIHIVVISIEGSRVRLGIEAPQEVQIFRDELRLHPAS